MRKSEVGSANRACELVGLRALLGRALAGVLDGQRGGDDHDLAGDDRRPPSTIMRASRGSIGSCARARPISVSAAVAVQRAELGQQLDAVAHRAGVRRVDEREARDVVGRGRDADRDHLQDHRRERRAQDLRLGELGPGVEVVLASRGGSRCRRRRGRSGPERWLADACEIGSIGSRCTLVALE